MYLVVKTRRLIVPLMLLLATGAYGSDSPSQLTEADNGRTNSVRVGGKLEIVLQGNPTTGYAWEVGSFNANVLQQIGAVEYRQSEELDGKNRVGVGGKFIFRFKAVVPGQCQIKLIYRRSWETTSSDKIYSVMIEIK